MAVEIQGYCDERFGRVRGVFEQNFAERGDVGACFAATLEGEFVVDIWAGHCDAARTRPWEEDTIVCTFSCTKTMAYLMALILADRGQLDLDAPVANYWPEFAANGKEGMLVRQLLSHSAGLPGFSRPLQWEEQYDWDLCCADLASQKPWWEPGTQSGYHALTHGFLVGELVRRVTEKSFGTAFREEIAEKVEADFHVGTDPRHFDRIADMIPAAEPLPAMSAEEVAALDPESVLGRLTRNPVVGDLWADEGALANSEGWRRAEQPAGSGHGNARAIVRAQTALANGGRAFGVELLSEAGCLRALEEQTDGIDVVMMRPIRYAMGYAHPSPENPACPNPNALFWCGYGGSSAVVDIERRVCLSYVMNQVQVEAALVDPRASLLAEAVYDGL